MSDAIEGPFYSHTAGYTPAELGDAAESITSYIEDLGPFDGVIGFSQGAAQALSYIHQHQVEQNFLGESQGDNLRGDSPPFKFAVCFSSTVPISRDRRCYEEILHGLSTIGHQRDVWLASPSSSSFSSASSSPRHLQESDSESVDFFPFPLDPAQRMFVECLTRSFRYAKEVGVVERNFDDDFFGIRATGDEEDDDNSGGGDICGRSTDHIPRVMNPELLPQLVKVPTVHITGKQDHAHMTEMSDMARGICDRKLMRVLRHSGGHSIPRKTSEVQQVVLAIEWAIDQSQKSYW